MNTKAIPSGITAMFSLLFLFAFVTVLQAEDDGSDQELLQFDQELLQIDQELRPVISKTDEADSGETAEAEAGKVSKNCVQACLSWGKMCNVDIRGQYKCRRTCEKFGELCE